MSGANRFVPRMHRSGEAQAQSTPWSLTPSRSPRSGRVPREVSLRRACRARGAGARPSFEKGVIIRRAGSVGGFPRGAPCR
jgi:hypothetical protein